MKCVCISLKYIMGNILYAKKEDDAWKRKWYQIKKNPVYRFVNLAKGGTLIDAYIKYGPLKFRTIAKNELSRFFYNEHGKCHCITEIEYLRYRWKLTRRSKGLDDSEMVSDKLLEAERREDYFNKFIPHNACWDLEKRGEVGETPFHLLILVNTSVHFEVARILLQMYPNLALDVYEGDEYYGESALHIAIVCGEFRSVQMLVTAGALVNQRATGRFFLPDDQKSGYTRKTNYKGYAYYGEYPLAFAACMGDKKMYNYLLDHGADPDLQDSFGNTVLHMVVISDRRDMYKYAARHHTHPASTTIRNKQNLTPLTLACLLGNHSIFLDILDLETIKFWSFSTTECSAYPLQNLDSIAPDGSTNWGSALMIILNGKTEGHLEMLEGGVMRQLLIEKWKAFAEGWFKIHLLSAIIHLVFFSISVYTRPAGPDLIGYRGPVDTVRYISEIIVCLLSLAALLRLIKELCREGLSIMLENCAHSPSNTLYRISCLLTVACIPFRCTGHYDIEDGLLILAAPCGWTIFLFFARGYSQTGPFITMIYKMISGDLFSFIIIYVILISGFTQAFFFLFQCVMSETTHHYEAKFSSLSEAMLYVFEMSLGNFKYEIFSLSHYGPLSKILFVLFMILVPILMLNMLIAKMAHTYIKVISKSTKEWWKQWARIIVILEFSMSKSRLMKIQQNYSVKLTGAPVPGDGSQSPAENFLVVVQTCPQSRASRYRNAKMRWKAAIKRLKSGWV